MNLFVTSLAIDDEYTHRCDMEIETGFQGIRVGNIPLQAVKLHMSHNNVVGENTVLQLNILETGVLTLVVQNSSPTRPTRVRTPVSKMFRWRTYNTALFNDSIRHKR